jgi:hypothetical protein
VRVLLGRAVSSAYAAMDEREGRGCYAPTLVVDTPFCIVPYFVLSPKFWLTFGP